MANPVRQEGSAASPPAAAADEIAPYLLSREYEDHLDWLENQRDSRNRRSRRRAWLGAFSGVAALAVSVAGVMMRKKS
jgi:hypothetical protein